MEKHEQYETTRTMDINDPRVEKVQTATGTLYLYDNRVYGADGDKIYLRETTGERTLRSDLCSSDEKLSTRAQDHVLATATTQIAQGKKMNANAKALAKAMRVVVEGVAEGRDAEAIRRIGQRVLDAHGVDDIEIH